MTRNVISIVIPVAAVAYTPPGGATHKFVFNTGSDTNIANATFALPALTADAAASATAVAAAINSANLLVNDLPVKASAASATVVIGFITTGAANTLSGPKLVDNFGNAITTFPVGASVDTSIDEVVVSPSVYAAYVAAGVKIGAVSAGVK